METGPFNSGLHVLLPDLCGWVSRDTVRSEDGGLSGGDRSPQTTALQNTGMSPSVHPSSQMCEMCNYLDALVSPDPEVAMTALLFLKIMVTSFPKFGQSLVSYYKQLLPALNGVLQQSKKASSGKKTISKLLPTQKSVIGPTVAIYQELEREVEELFTALEKTGGPVGLELI